MDFGADRRISPAEPGAGCRARKTVLREGGRDPSVARRGVCGFLLRVVRSLMKSPLGCELEGLATFSGSERVQESDAAHPGRSTSAVIPRPGHAVACFHTRGCRAEESPVGLLEGRRGSQCLLRGYDAGGQGQYRSGATGHQQQTVDFSVGALDFVRADGAVWRLLRNDIRARAQGFLNTLSVRLVRGERRHGAPVDAARAGGGCRERERDGMRQGAIRVFGGGMRIGG
jgi:hypothetical protein